jgi:hypothetical protein
MRVINNTYMDEAMGKRATREQKHERVKRERTNSQGIFKDAAHTNGSLKRTEAQLKKF